MAVIDGATNELVTAVPTGACPYALLFVTQSNKVYCADDGCDSMTVIDCASNQVVASVAAGRSPRVLCRNPLTDRVFCANYGGGSVSVVDGSSDSLLVSIATGVEPMALACDSIRNRVYVANRGSNTISVIRDSLTGIEEGERSVAAVKSLMVSSNPIRGNADIRFQLTKQGRVLLDVRDIAGRTVAVLADGVMNPGEYRRDWAVAPAVPTGIYFLSLKTPGCTETRKLILTR